MAPKVMADQMPFAEDRSGVQRRRSAWIVAFGPVGAGSDGYLVRVNATARCFEEIGYSVTILEVSKREHWAALSTAITAVPAWPAMASAPRILGPISWIAEVRNQVALFVGLIRNAHRMRRAEVIVIEGGLLAATLGLRLLPSRRRPVFVFDVHTVMSALHRHGMDSKRSARCGVACRLRRRVWRMLERICSNAADKTVVCSTGEIKYFSSNSVSVVPHGIPEVGALRSGPEDSHVLGFVGSGRVSTNREALAFLMRDVLSGARSRETCCWIIGDSEGYTISSDRVKYLGFCPDLGKAAESISVFCAPMQESGGVSTKVLLSLLCGKRTVCTPEAAEGIVRPNAGLWIAERPYFAAAVESARSTPWSPRQAEELRNTLLARHGFAAIVDNWREALATA